MRQEIISCDRCGIAANAAVPTVVENRAYFAEIGAGSDFSVRICIPQDLCDTCYEFMLRSYRGASASCGRPQPQVAISHK